MLLENVRSGDFFFVQCGGNARATCIMTSISGFAVYARSITTQMILQFDIRTGEGNSGEGDYACKVVSVVQPPANVAEVLNNIDRKYRLLNAPEGVRLLKREIEALIYVDDHYFT